MACIRAVGVHGWRARSHATSTSTATTVGLNDTGVTTCVDAARATVSCTAAPAASAEQAAVFAVKRRATGQEDEIRDTMIAGIALARKATIMTRNVKDFNHSSLTIINPWA